MEPTKYTDFKEWKAEVIKRGFTTYTYADVENGPSAQDMYEPTYAIDGKASKPEEAAAIGIWQVSYPDDAKSDADGVWYGVIFNTPEQYQAWDNPDDGGFY